jgi:hypothetical protein
MAGLNNIREAYSQIYSQLDERMSDDEKEMRRLAAQERRAGKSDRLDSKVGAKYAESEKKSAEREDKKSKGKHIHGMADSVEVEGDLVDEAKQPFPAKKVAKQMAKAKAGSVYGRPASRDAVPNVSDSEKKETTRFSKMFHASEKAKREKQNADKARRSSTFYKDTHPASAPKMAKAQREEFEVDEAKDNAYLETDMEKRKKNNEKAIEDMKKTKAHADMVKAARKHFEEVIKEEDPCWKGYTQVGMKKKNGREVPNCVPSKGVPKAKGYKKEELELDERTLDTAETGEKERLVKGMKKSAADFKKRYGERAKSVMYATATKMAKKHMDTSKSDRRYAVEETSMEENADLENRKVGPRKPSQIAKREKLNKLIDEIRSKKEGESK